MTYAGYAKYPSSKSYKAEINGYFSSLQVSISILQEAHFHQRQGFYSGRLGQLGQVISLVVRIIMQLQVMEQPKMIVHRVWGGNKKYDDQFIYITFMHPFLFRNKKRERFMEPKHCQKFQEYNQLIKIKFGLSCSTDKLLPENVGFN